MKMRALGGMAKASRADLQLGLPLLLLPGQREPHFSSWNNLRRVFFLSTQDNRLYFALISREQEEYSYHSLK